MIKSEQKPRKALCNSKKRLTLAAQNLVGINQLKSVSYACKDQIIKTR
jgi:hypothetical protein